MKRKKKNKESEVNKCTFKNDAILKTKILVNSTGENCKDEYSVNNLKKEMRNNETFSRLMYNVPSHDQLKGHDNHPEVIKAVMLLWENSGRGKFAQLKDVLINNKNIDVNASVQKNMNVIKCEILKEKLEFDDNKALIKRFLNKLCNKKKLITCASCGERTYNSWYKEVSVEKELSLLKLNSHQINDYERLEEFKTIASVSNVNNNLYYIHPECLTIQNDIHKTNLCTNCYDDIKKNSIPKLSVANGHDYGDFRRHHHLQSLTLVEKHLISFNRLYGNILKIKEGENRQLLGNLITFEQNGPEKCAEQFNLPDIQGIQKVLRIAFVGSKENYEIKRKDVIMKCGELQVRSKNVYNWLRMLKKCNPKYWNIQINESEECINVMNNITQVLLDNIEIIDSKSLIKVDRIVTDDTSKVRQINENETSTNFETLNVNSGTSEISISNSMLFSDNNAIEGSKIVERTLHGVATTVYPKLIKVSILNDEPINEYENNNKLYLGLFPYLFIFGTFGNGVQIKGTFPKKFVSHLMNQR